MTQQPALPRPLFSYKPFWAKRLTPASVFPVSLEDMEKLGWDACDVVLVTGDAFVDHPSFGAAIIARLLEEHGFRVGIIAQPDWSSANPFKALGRPNLFWGITSGNMDSMVNHYTAERKIRTDDAYSPDGKAGLRPDRATIVYSQRCREAFADVPIVLGGIEASLRRIAHYDYWQDKIRNSILVDAKADYLCYGNAERSIVELAHLLAQPQTSSEQLNSIRGVATLIKSLPDSMPILDISLTTPSNSDTNCCLRLPCAETVRANKQLFALSVRTLYREGAAENGRVLIQPHRNQFLYINPPAYPLTTDELDKIYRLPFTRKPHPIYKEQKIPAFEMIRHSVTLMRGCFGGCAFCSLAIHEGKTIQNRSPASIVEELELIRDTDAAFTGAISDLGGPSANMYKMGCQNPTAKLRCRRTSCLYPKPCVHLNRDHAPLLDLYQKVRKIPGIKTLRVASGVRYDLALNSRDYIDELVKHFVGGYLKIAPEHTENATLQQMHKPDIELYEQFAALFNSLSKKAGKEQYMIPYFIAAHPGSRNEDMLNLALWLKSHRYHLEQVQNFYPTPLTLASTAWYTGLDMNDPKLERSVPVARGEKQRRIQKAFLRYHDPANHNIIRNELVAMGRSDLIGFGKQYLVPPLHQHRRKPANQPNLSAKELQSTRPQGKRTQKGGMATKNSLSPNSVNRKSPAAKTKKVRR